MSQPMAPIIQVKNLGKQYALGEAVNMFGNLRELLSQGLGRSFKRLAGFDPDGDQPRDAGSFWALKDVSFDVEKGDTLAIIGSNGAGKSTLLKVLSRITDPTEGYVKVQGQVASLLEVGTGFHPELSGRENIFLNGAIMGMPKSEIRAKFDDIVGFSGIGKFLDTPVKRYSSGMYVRLAFAIAAHLEPEILIVDEVLAVGDVAFQKKCLGKMAEATQHARTVLFVSHNLAAVEALCKKGIVLNQGQVAFSGTAKDAVEYYLHNLAGQGTPSGSHIIDLGASANRSAKHRPILKGLELYSEGHRPFCGELPVGGSLKAIVRLYFEEPCTAFEPFLSITAHGGQLICTACSAYEPSRVHQECLGDTSFVCEIPCLPLVPGEYRIDVGIYFSGLETDLVEDVARLTVSKSDFYGTGIVPTRGIFCLQNRWSMEEEKKLEINA
jgi:lipopolysaccharide transport system ATP-binding protein